MSSTTQVEALFFAALEKGTAAERAAYLHAACAGDAELRRQVEKLLKAYPRVGDFLKHPIIAQLAPAPDPSDATQAVDGSTANKSAAPGEGACTLPPTEGGRSIDHEEIPLDFLEPSNRADALGRIGHYDVLEVLGHGGFGIVFRALDGKLQRVVAVKVLAPQLAVTSPARKRFLREARSSAQVRHENVVQIYAVGEQPLPYLVMEFVPGETLQQRLDRTGPLETAEVVQFGRQIAEGLSAAHATGLIHRDIKPGNILIEASPHPRARITDFGLARAADDASVSQSGVVAGTPMFMAPEQAQGEALDHRADLFSLGSVLYAMCSGRPPFRAKTTLAVLKRVVEDTPRPLREIMPEVPQWLCDIIACLHAKKPDDRFATAREVADLLGRCLEDMHRPGQIPRSPEVPRAAGEKSTPTGPRFHYRRWVTATAVLLLLLGGLGFTEATGVTDFRGTVIRLIAPEGTLVVEVDDAGVSVQIDGSELVITGTGAREIRLKPGNYKVEASKDGKLVRQELVTVTKNGRQVVRVSQEAPPDTKAAPRSADASAWERSVSTLPTTERLKAVALRLQKLNPGFDGAVTTNMEHGEIRGLRFKTDHVIDLSPLRVLTELQSLDCSGSDAFSRQLADDSSLPLKAGAHGQINIRTVARSRLTDLAPLQGLPLTSLSIVNSNVYDLSPLKGMKLTTLHCGSTNVYDLTALEGMPLEDLDCSFTKVSDLRPLKGMKLTRADFDQTEVADLTPLTGMPLVYLSVGRRVTDLMPLTGMALVEFNCSGSGVSDLSPLQGMPLVILACRDTKVTNIKPLQGMKTLKRLGCCDGVADLAPLRGLALNYLHAGPLVTDLAVLKGMPLEKLEFKTFMAERDAALLRAIPTLKEINDIPAARFWKEVDAAKGTKGTR